MRGTRSLAFLAKLPAILLLLAAESRPDSFHFAILGDRTGGTEPGVYEQIWKEAARDDPAFLVCVGDTIEGLNDATAEREWLQIEQVLAPYRQYPLFLVPGNHDIWSELSGRLFRKYARRALHYSFDYQRAHFTILDNSRSEEFSAEELKFLESDLQAHTTNSVKFIVSHRPSWLLDMVLHNSNHPIHRLAKKYGVQYVIAGHIHQMLHVHLDGVTYISMVSSGGRLRASRKYDDGWFFGYALVNVSGKDVKLQIKELNSPHGQGRVTKLEDWGVAGLVNRNPAASRAVN